MKEINKLDPFEEEIWDDDYQPSLRKESEWIPFDWDLGNWGSAWSSASWSTTENSQLHERLSSYLSNSGISGSSGTSSFQLLPQVRRIESFSGKKVRRKGTQPKYKNFPVKTDSRSEFIKKDKYGR